MISLALARIWVEQVQRSTEGKSSGLAENWLLSQLPNMQSFVSSEEPKDLYTSYDIPMLEVKKQNVIHMVRKFERKSRQRKI